MIHWDKPVEFSATSTPVRIERVLGNGDAIVSWDHDGISSTACAVFSPNTRGLRNVVLKPIERWLNLYERAEYNFVFPSASMADAAVALIDTGIFGMRIRCVRLCEVSE
jgi:hypothetical protein